MRRSYSKVSGKFPEQDLGSFPLLIPSLTSSPESPKKGNKLSCAMKALQCSSRAGCDATSDVSEEKDVEGFNPFYPYHLRSELNGTLYGGKSEWKTAAYASEEPATTLSIGDDDDDDDDDDDLADLNAAPSPSQETNTRQQGQDYPDAYAFASSKATSASSESHVPSDPRSRQSHTHADTESEDGINVGPSKERMARGEQIIFPTESIDEIPYEESNDSSEPDDRPQSPHHYGSPLQIFSEDTHDTPIQSNVQQQPPGGSTNKRASAPEVKLDALCSNYFNTPHNQGVNSTAPLGDSITPVTSPVDDEDEVRLRRTLGVSPGHKARLQQLADSFVATKLQDLPRLDHPSRNKSDEKKVPDLDDAIQLTPDDASVTIGGQEAKASRLPTGEFNNVKLTKLYSETSGSGSHTKTDSSFSSVSSFTHVASGGPLRGRSKLALERASAGTMLTPHPFFWRSHPKITVTSYQPQSSIRQIAPQFNSVPTTDDLDDSFTMNILNYSGSDHIPHNMPSPARCGSQKDSTDYKPYLHPAAVRKLWLASEPFRLQVNSNWQPNIGSTSHPQGPPSPGQRSSRAIPAPDQKRWGSVVNFPAVFSRFDGKIKSDVTG